MTQEQLNTPVGDQDFDSFWSGVAESEKLGGRGGGTIGRIQIGFGWKLYPKRETGIKPNEAFFPFDPRNKEETKAQKAKANQFVIDKGLTGNPEHAFMIRIYKDDVLNKDVSQWEDDRYYTIGTWTDAWLTTVQPELQKLGVKSVGDMWARVTWKQDLKRKPKPVNKLDAEGNPIIDEFGNPVMEDQYPLFAYVAEIYASKEEAMKAAGVVAETTSSASLPEGYDQAAWEMIVAEIKKAKEGGMALPQIAKDYGLDMKWITQALNS